MKSYCGMNNGDCKTCGLANHGRDCRNHPVDMPEEAVERLDRRVQAMKAVNDAPDFESEQEAIKKAFVVDIRPSLPKGAVDLYNQWDTAKEPDHSGDYGAVMKAIGASYDRGARRYVVRDTMVPAVRDALVEAGFLPCLGLSLAVE